MICASVEAGRSLKNAVCNNLEQKKWLFIENSHFFNLYIFNFSPYSLKQKKFYRYRCHLQRV